MYKFAFPNGKIYVGTDHIGVVTCFGSPSNEGRIAGLGLTARKEILWKSDTVTDAEGAGPIVSRYSSDENRASRNRAE
jgi:hypothetical protein